MAGSNDVQMRVLPMFCLGISDVSTRNGPTAAEVHIGQLFVVSDLVSVSSEALRVRLLLFGICSGGFSRYSVFFACSILALAEHQNIFSHSVSRNAPCMA